ncbi:sensor histidine kinase [Georgenia sp. H159]|uniref:sensor histidine kinase n=1 Tax=Georgenia sp. H159 TaxID=3076115 RepID=UPI002D770C58|nr:histidine kinase [Georgenia sp. H159]
MQEVLGLWRERVRGTERARVVSDAAGTLVLGLLLLTVGLVGLWRAGPDTERWVFVLTLAAACVVMLGKARWPLLTLGAGLVVFAVDIALGGSTGVMVAVLDLIYSAALRASAAAVRRLGITVAVGVAGSAAATFVVTGDVRDSANAALLVFAVFGTPLWWGRSVRQQTELAGLASARARDLARLGEMREQEVVHAERTRMAGDIHDALASHLSAIAIHSEGALSAPRPASVDDAAARDRQALSAIRHSSVAALREMRSMIDLLRTGDEAPTRPARLEEVGTLVAVLREQGMEVALSVPADLPELPAAVDQAAFRIIQESLTNALKHGDGAHVDVTVALADAVLRVEVANGVALAAVDGAPVPPSSGVGLLTMRERAEALGGSLSTGGTADRWYVRAAVPVKERP